MHEQTGYGKSHHWNDCVKRPSESWSEGYRRIKLLIPSWGCRWARHQLSAAGRSLATILAYKRYLANWLRYARMSGAEPLRIADRYPCVLDWTATTDFDEHYFYQAVWAMRKILHSQVFSHVDAGSDHRFVGMLSAHVPVTFVDTRPLNVELACFRMVPGSILALPFMDESIYSMSCLHVIEHIGLGRYGDDLDPQGTRKAAAELSRVLALGGNLYVSLPIGRPHVCFNAHRIHSPQQVLEYFASLELVEFSVVDDGSRFLERADPNDYRDSSYACGMYWFQKRLDERSNEF